MKSAKNMREIENTGDMPICPSDGSVCVAVHGRSGPKVGTYVVVRCIACKEEFKVGPKK